MYQVKIYNGNDVTEIHSPYPNKIKLLEGSNIKKGINTFDSFEFSLLPDNPGFQKLRPMNTLITVLDTLRNKEVFRGRVLIPTNQMDSDETFEYSYLCASVLSFLQDTIQDYAKIQNTTPEQFFRYLIDVHNSKVKEPYKKFVVGKVTVTNSTDNVYRYVDETKTTFETIKEKLIDRIGGELQVRYENGVNYIDYLETAGKKSETTIEVEKNMLSFSKEIDPTDVVTVFYPRGARPETDGESENGGEYSAAEPRLTISSVNGGKDYLLASQEMIDEFGYVEGSQAFDDINDPQILKTRGQQFLDRQKAALVKYQLQAVDLSLLNIDPETYEVGNYHTVKNKYLGVEEALRIEGMTIDLINPEVSSLTIGDKTKMLSDYQKEVNAANRAYKELQSSVTELAKSNIKLGNSLKIAQDDLNKIQEELINVDLSNLPVEFQKIANQISGLQSVLDEIQIAVDNIPTYKPADSTSDGLLTSELYVKLMSVQLATQLIDGLMSKEDKNKLDSYPSDLTERLIALEGKVI